jgi:hypothetical protein
MIRALSLSWPGESAPHEAWSLARRKRSRRRELGFAACCLAGALLLVFAWQQHRCARLMAEVTRLEAREDALRARLLALGAEVTRYRQPEHVLSELPGASEVPDLATCVFVPSSHSELAADGKAAPVWLASLGLQVPEARASDPN